MITRVTIEGSTACPMAVLSFWSKCSYETDCSVCNQYILLMFDQLCLCHLVLSAVVNFFFFFVRST